MLCPPSDLYLDADQEDYDLDYRPPSYTGNLFDAVETIFWDDVYPTLIHNLARTGGDWIPFDPNWVCNEVEARRRSAVTMAVSRVIVPVSWWLWSRRVSSLWTAATRSSETPMEIKLSCLTLERFVALSKLLRIALRLFIRGIRIPVVCPVFCIMAVEPLSILFPFGPRGRKLPYSRVPHTGNIRFE